MTKPPTPEGDEGSVQPSTTMERAEATPGPTVADAPDVVIAAIQGIGSNIITEPCVVDGMSDEVYHRDPVKAGSLSHSGMKTLMTDSPAFYRASLDGTHPREPKDAFDLGHAVHFYVLGVGAEIEVVHAKDWRGKAAQQQRAAAREAGRVPILEREDAKARGMAKAIRSNPRTGHLFERERGTPERAMFWYDEEFGVWRRAKLDWTCRLADGRLAIVDVKSRGSQVNREGIAKALWDFWYYTQDAYYRDGVRALLDDEQDPVFLFVFQETRYPYLVTVVEMDDEAQQWGRLKVREALDRYARCVGTGEWPDHMGLEGLAVGEPMRVGLPRWSTRALEDQWASGALDIR